MAPPAARIAITKMVETIVRSPGDVEANLKNRRGASNAGFTNPLNDLPRPVGCSSLSIHRSASNAVTGGIAIKYIRTK